METKKDKVKKEVEKRSNHKLIADYPTQKKRYKKGDNISVTEKGAKYLRKIKRIK